MTDRYNAFVVVLEEDMRDDDAATLIAAIGLLKGVASVSPHIRGLEETIATERARLDLQRKLYDALRPDWLKPKTA